MGPHQPVEDSGAVTAHGRVAVKGEEHVTLSAELAHKALGLAPLAVQLDVLGEERVGLGERAAQAARVRVQQVLDGVGLVALHEVLPVLELRAQRGSALKRPVQPHWLPCGSWPYFTSPRPGTRHFPGS